MMRTSVVIPFFQRQPGLLSRAVASVRAQSGVEPPRILVTDDGSPVPAAAEDVAGCEVVRIPNGGPGAARNLALDRARGSEYVAFLDSDDAWQPNHLARAERSLDAGYDLYFSDYLEHPGHGGGTGFAGSRAFGAAGHEPLGDEIFRFLGDFFDRTLRRSPILTSTVVYRFAKFPHLRFVPPIAPAEDEFFFLQLAQLTDRIVFSTRAETIYGEGENISHARDPVAGLRLHGKLRDYQLFLLSALQLSPEQRSVIEAKLREIRAALLWHAKHAAARGRLIAAARALLAERRPKPALPTKRGE